MKRLLSLFLVFIMCITLVACGESDDSEEVAKLKKKIEKLESQLEAYESGDIETDDKKTDNTIKDTDGFTVLELGESVTLDFVNITLDETVCLQEILPTDTSSVYSYVADEENEQYWCLVGTIKNTHGEKYDVENIVAELYFDNKYTYTAKLKADDGGSDFYGNDVKPLDSVKFYIYSSVPDEMIDKYSSCTVKFGFKENFDGSSYDDFEDCDYLYKLTINK